MKLIVLLARGSRELLVSAVVASVINGLLVSGAVSTLNRALDENAVGWNAIALQFAALSVAMLAFRWLALGQFVRLSQRVLAGLRLHVSRGVATAPYRTVEQKGQGRVLAVLTEDTSTVGECFMVLPWILVHGVILIGCLGYLAVLSWQLLLIALAIASVGTFRYGRGARAAHAHLQEARLEEDRLFTHLRALFSGAKELRLHDARREAFLVEALGASNERVRAARTRGLSAHAALANWRLMLVFLVIGCVLFVLGPQLGVAPAVRSGYAMTLLYMLLPINALLEAMPAISRMQVALERIEGLGLDAAAHAAPLADQPARTTFASLRLDAVTHRYRGEGDSEQAFQLGPITLELRPSEVVFLVGGNGSGKTTLAKLIAGLYEPDAGQVWIDGRPIDAGARDIQRGLFAAVFSDFHVFDQVLAADGETERRARALLEALDLAHKVSIQGGKLSTTALSSGQRRRLALLAAWLEDRPVYLFDEWAADQDPTYKEVFYREVLPELRAQGKAVLVISHDDRYFDAADRCLHLEQGVLSEIGPVATEGRRAGTRADIVAPLAAGEP